MKRLARSSSEPGTKGTGEDPQPPIESCCQAFCPEQPWRREHTSILSYLGRWRGVLSIEQSGPQIVKPPHAICWAPELAQRHMRRGGSCLETLSPPGPPVCNPAEAMPSPGNICSLLLLGMLWLDLAMAGSSFLSPEHQRVQVRASHKAPHAD